MSMHAQQETELIAQMESENEEFRRLRTQHHEYEEKLHALAGKHVLTDDEKLEEVRIKKEKLFLKDRMAAIRRDYVKSRQS